ncbi:hypothetical protein QQM79_18620 [Marinobacteraceae bacterium S3BR75-40.1]
MIWQLIATVVAGFGAAGIALLIRAVTRRKAPKWLVPVFAGLGMLGYQIHWEYTWFDHNRAQLPEGALVVSTAREPSILRPWSYMATPVSGFTVLDEASIQQAPKQADVFRFQLYRFERSSAGRAANSAYLLNCSERELARLAGQGEGEVTSIRRLPATDPLLFRVCRGGAGSA